MVTIFQHRHLYLYNMLEVHAPIKNKSFVLNRTKSSNKFRDNYSTPFSHFKSPAI